MSNLHLMLEIGFQKIHVREQIHANSEMLLIQIYEPLERIAPQITDSLSAQIQKFIHNSFLFGPGKRPLGRTNKKLAGNP